MSIGRGATLSVSTDGVTYTAIGKLTSVSFSFAHDVADAESFDDAGNKAGEYASSQATGSATCRYLSSNAGQAIVITEITAKAGLYFRYRPVVGAGHKQFIFFGQLTSSEVPAETGSVIDFSFGFQSSGAITVSNQ